MKASLIKKEHTNLFSAVSETQPTGAKPAGKMRPGSGPKVRRDGNMLTRTAFDPETISLLGARSIKRLQIVPILASRRQSRTKRSAAKLVSVSSIRRSGDCRTPKLSGRHRQPIGAKAPGAEREEPRRGGGRWFARELQVRSSRPTTQHQAEALVTVSEVRPGGGRLAVLAAPLAAVHGFYRIAFSRGGRGVNLRNALPIWASATEID
jgi:hypothetical protein